MCRILKLSSVGKKVIVAVTGLILVGFIIAHLLGNLFIYAGPDAFNSYAEKLHHYPAFLWAARIGLLAAVIAHVAVSIQLAIENRAARPIAYKMIRTSETTLAARGMVFSAIMVFAFIVYHLLHLTFRLTNPEVSHLTDALGRSDVYSMVVLSFQNIYISLAYIIGIVMLFMHLSHGIASACQSLGLNNEATIPIVERAGNLLAIVLSTGYIAIPISVMLGLLAAPGAGP